MKKAITILLLLCGKIAFTQESPSLDTLEDQIYIRFSVYDAKEIVRWNEERLACKDYVSILHDKIQAQEAIINNYEQITQNDSVSYVSQEVIITQVKNQYKALIGTNAKLSLKLSQADQKSKIRGKYLIGSVILNAILLGIIAF